MLLKNYINYLRESNCSELTISHYKNILSKLLKNELNFNNVRDFIVSYSNGNTQQNYYAIIKSFLTYSKKFELINELANIRLSKQQPKLYCTLTREQILKRLKISINDNKRTIIKKLTLLFIFETGIRVFELSKLKYENNNIYVINGKGKKTREIMYNYETFSALRPYFDYIQKLTRQTIHRWCKTYFYDFNISPHSLRRSFATYLSKKGMNIQLIQRQLGHSNINTTYLYIHNNKDEIINAYNKYMINK